MCEETVRMAVIKMGYQVTSEQGYPGYKGKTNRSESPHSNSLINRSAFLDESGINLGIIRRYSRAVGGKQVVDHVPLTRPIGTTLLSSI